MFTMNSVMFMGKFVQINEVGLRDGIQNLNFILPTPLKLNLIEILVKAGLKNIEVASFVHPKRVPQMVDAELVLNQLSHLKNVNLIGLVLNERGLERALNTAVNTIQTIIYGTDSFAKENAGLCIESSKEVFLRVCEKAKHKGIRIMASIAVAFGCRYEGWVDQERILESVNFLKNHGADVISLADSTGMAKPPQVYEICSAAMKILGDIPLNLHLHNTENMGYANLYAALTAGVTSFDTSFGGLGGCPFIPEAAGNIATEDTLHMLEGMGYSTQIDKVLVAKASIKMQETLKQQLPGKLYQLLEKKIKLL